MQASWYPRIVAGEAIERTLAADETVTFVYDGWPNMNRLDAGERYVLVEVRGIALLGQHSLLCALFVWYAWLAGSWTRLTTSLCAADVRGRRRPVPRSTADGGIRSRTFHFLLRESVHDECHLL